MKLAYTIQELAEKGGGSRTTIYEAINNGTLKAKKRGKSTIILAAVAEMYLENLPDYEPRPIHADGPGAEAA